MTYFLGIDGGGTKTSCVVGDDTSVLSVGVAGGCNIVRLGAEQSRANLHVAIRQACEKAGVSPQEVAQVTIGAAGISATDVRESLRRFVGELLPCSIDVVGDHDIAFEAAFAGEPGVIIAAGTGSIACGRNSKGQIARAGGHGFAISDEGSGHWIGRTAVARTLAARDRGEPTILDGLIAETLQIQPSELVKKANAVPAPDFASLFPAVLRAAEAGDAIAVGVLNVAGAELAKLTVVVILRLWEQDKPVRVGMVGGVFANSEIVRTEFASRLRANCRWVEVLPEVVDPLLGALSLARKSASLLRK
jgi:N-acetylglucosamine kinase-like BadF-type ATPase